MTSASSNRSGPARTLAVLLLGSLWACGAEPEAKPTGTAMGARSEAQRVAAEQPPALNQSPRIESVAIRPEAPQPGEMVTAEVRASDPEGDSLEFSYEWQVDGRRVGDRASLHVQDFGRNARIEVIVRAGDGQSQSEPGRASVGMGNRPPILMGAVIEPRDGVTADRNVSVVPRGQDPDGDDLEFRYTWFVNGTQQWDTEGPMLVAERFERGDRVSVTIVASDGTNESEPLESQAFSIANSPPRITTAPGAFDPDGVFRYRVGSVDPDGDDLLRFRLVEGPSGMNMDPVSGEIAWAPGEDQVGEHRVEIAVDDRQGGVGRQSFQLSLDFELVPASPADAY